MIEVRRMPRNTMAGFERIPNRAIRNVELSLSAVGLLARLLADGEQYDSIDDIAAAFNPAGPGQKTPYGFGRDVYRKAALELEAAGYLVRTEEKGAGSRTRSLARAIPEKAQVGATTDSPSRDRRGQTGIGAAQAQDGQSVVGMTWENDAYEHVAAMTDSPSRRSPAERSFSARQSRDGQSVADYIQTSPQTPDVLNQASEHLDGGAEGETAVPENPADPDVNLAEQAHAILDGLPTDRRTNDGDRKALVPAIIARLKLGWPAAVVGEYLSERSLPEKVISLRGLLTNWLPPDRPYTAPKQAAPTATGLPPWCGSCGGDSVDQAKVNAKFRTLDGEPKSPPCPRCHPDQIGPTP